MTWMSRSLAGLVLLAACRFEGPSVDGDDPGADAMGGANGSGTAPWLGPWTHRKPITLQASKIEAPGDGALTGFPVLVSVTDADLAAVVRPGGEDLVFTAGDGTTVLASEIESYTSSNGQLVAWVKVPSLPATVDTKLYVYYGHDSPPARTPEAVWTESYLAVWHLHQDPGPGGPGEIRDATSGNRDGTALQMESIDSVPARIGRGLTFNGNDEFVDFGQVDVGNTFTISMWVLFGGASSVRPLMTNSTLGGDTNGFRLFINSANTSDRRILFETGNGSSGSVRRAFTDAYAINLYTLTHVAAVVNRAAGTAEIFVNGEKATAAAGASIRTDFQANSDFELARVEDTSFHFSGVLDEIRVATTLRSAEWLKTSFHNQSQPDSFHTLGAEERAP